MDTWQEVRKGLFVVDAEVETAPFLDRMVEMARRNNAGLTVVHCLVWRNRLDGAARRRRRSMPC